jgi:hypothetical protein
MLRIIFKPEPMQRRTKKLENQFHHLKLDQQCPEPVFLNVYGAQESIPRNEFRQPM